MPPVELIVVSPLIATPAALLLYGAAVWALIGPRRVRRRAQAGRRAQLGRPAGDDRAAQEPT